MKLVLLMKKRTLQNHKSNKRNVKKKGMWGMSQHLALIGYLFEGKCLRLFENKEKSFRSRAHPGMTLGHTTDN